MSDVIGLCAQISQTANGHFLSSATHVKRRAQGYPRRNPEESVDLVAMSWIFGVGNKSQGDVPQFPVPPSAGPGGDGSGDGSGDGGKKGGGGGIFGKQMDAYRFDSAALERAAKAAKELERSSKLLDLTQLKVQSEIVLFVVHIHASIVQ